MQAAPCVFPDPVAWGGDPVGHCPPPTTRVLTDFSVPPFDVPALAAVARVLAGSCDAVLVGDHQDRPDFPPTQSVRLLRAAGLEPWVTLACRDRNRVVLEQELRGLAHEGIDAVLCVTGDGRAYDVAPEITQVFDLDGTRLAALAAGFGLAAAVAETPSAPPTSARPARLVSKQRAGAAVAVLNHVGSPDAVGGFMAAARAAGLTIPVIASVAVYTDRRSAAALQGLPGLELDPGTVRAVLHAPDPVAAGIAAAVAEAGTLLDVEGVTGVNVSGMASARGYLHAAEIKAEVGHRLQTATP